mmetsp:Transcript_1674/g.3909  ORF Transcript_1674/g.3909 Transcript_1674/m.3909 type:complete len:282 (+) Transcript_1674:301-1146(+)
MEAFTSLWRDIRSLDRATLAGHGPTAAADWATLCTSTFILCSIIVCTASLSFTRLFTLACSCSGSVEITAEAALFVLRTSNSTLRALRRAFSSFSALIIPPFWSPPPTPSTLASSVFEPSAASAPLLGFPVGDLSFPSSSTTFALRPSISPLDWLESSSSSTSVGPDACLGCADHTSMACFSSSLFTGEVSFCSIDMRWNFINNAVLASSFSSNSLWWLSYASNSSCRPIICSSRSTSLCVRAIMMSLCLSNSCLYRSTCAFSSSIVSLSLSRSANLNWYS